MKTIAIANQKGGVGKSTTAYHLADQARSSGKRVLILDLDPQGNLTSALTAEKLSEDTPGVANVLSGRTNASIDAVVIPSIWHNVDIVPTASDVILSAIRDELVISGAGREARLRQALANMQADEYDLVLIDCPPSIDLLTINALTAADEVLIVTHSKQWSSAGLVHLLNNIDQVKSYYNPSLKLGSIVVNQHENNTVSGANWLNELRSFAKTHSLPLFSYPIPKRVVIADCVEAQSSLADWPGNTDEVEDIYRTLCVALMN